MSKLGELLSDDVRERLEKIVKEEAKIVMSLEVPFIPTDSRVLVKPLDEIKVVKNIIVPDYEANEGKAPEDIQETKEIEDEVVSNLRVGVILAIDPSIDLPFQIGQKVVYVHRAAMPFDIFKDSVLLKRYDILGYWLGK